jgi:hypothetical protein
VPSINDGSSLTEVSPSNEIAIKLLRVAMREREDFYRWMHPECLQNQMAAGGALRLM